MNEENLIPIDGLKGDFEQFLKTEGNKRIFFSGRFGIGKTFFLKTFFELSKDEYEVFHVFPTNYQISANDDIVELLKYDILVQLTKKNPDLLKGNVVDGVKSSTLLFYSWLKEKYSLNEVLQYTISTGADALSISPDPLSSVLSKLGKPLKDLLTLDKEYQGFKEEYKAGDKGLAEKYIQEISSKNVSETDYLSHVITEKILELKSTKQSVLILDDMDRIDPDHIFRILNIFSAHFNDESNKFNFDSVIIVGDIENIKSIFHHKYGVGTDFEGYIDKFFSVKPYFLDNKTIVSESLAQLVKLIKYDEPELATAIGENGYIKLLLQEILNNATSLDKLNLRQLFKPLSFTFPELKKGSLGGKRSFYGNDSEQVLDIGIKLLIAIFGGDKKRFIFILEEIKNNIDSSNVTKLIPYNTYSGLMINSVTKPVTPGVKTLWNNYYYTLPSNSNDLLQVDGSLDVHAKFFYDLLIEYVKRSKYSKKAAWEYQR